MAYHPTLPMVYFSNEQGIGTLLLPPRSQRTAQG
jgi:hypothetical protein